jgi:hypothetical protein
MSCPICGIGGEDEECGTCLNDERESFGLDRLKSWEVEENE